MTSTEFFLYNLRYYFVSYREQMFKIWGVVRVASKQHFNHFAKHEILPKLFGTYAKFYENRIVDTRNFREFLINFAKFSQNSEIFFRF